jgi:hypothetical protein
MWAIYDANMKFILLAYFSNVELHVCKIDLFIQNSCMGLVVRDGVEMLVTSQGLCLFSELIIKRVAL